MSVLADHRVDPGDDGPPPAASRAPVTAAVDVPPGEALAEHPGTSHPATSYADTGYADTGYADPAYAGTDYADGEYGEGEYADGEYADQEHPDGGYPVPAAEPTPPRPDRLRPDQLRADFGAHFEAHYQRIVAQLYAITLNPAEAHDVVREAYSRAWRKWAEIGASADPAAWVRRVAVRSTMRSWRRTVARIRPGTRRALADGGEPRTRAALLALGRLRDAERRAVVLVDMAGVPVVEVAVLEQVPPGTIAARLSRGRRVVGDALTEAGAVLPASALGPGGRY